MFPEKNMPANAGTAVEEPDEEQVEINLDEKVEVKDQSKDFNVVPPPPTAGKYIVQWEIDEKGAEPRASKKVGTFLQIHLIGTLQADGEYNGYKINDYMNSIYSQLKQTSAVHDFLYKIGVEVPPSVSQGELKKIFEDALKAKPVGTISLEWRVSEKNPASPRANKDGYVTLKNKMVQFPKLPDGSYQNWVESGVDGSKLYAQAYVESHLKG